ncbi:MAG TPA: hypothetical protein VGD67_07975 [Pseudonocardiaceae bacterium]
MVFINYRRVSTTASCGRSARRWPGELRAAPTVEELPADIGDLAHRQGHRVRWANGELDGLVDAVRRAARGERR